MIFILIRFIPRKKIREAHAAYLFKLLITWSVGLCVAEFKLIEYPFRLFSYATKASFIFEFFLYPAICAVFIVNYPEKKGILHKLAYYFSYCTVLTIAEVIQERYTNIIKYINWNWSITWFTFLITFFLARKYNKWFFKQPNTPSAHAHR
jgi:hypothetical protein